MAHIHTADGQHDLTVSGLIIQTDGSQSRVLLHIHKKLGVYLHFGGHVELHETPWQAVLHELLEESGYEASQLQVLQPKQRFILQHEGRSVQHPTPFYFSTHPFDPDGQHYHSDTTFAFITREEPKHPIGAEEADTLRLFTAEDVRALNDQEIYPEMRELCLYALENSYEEWVPVPATSYR